MSILADKYRYFRVTGGPVKKILKEWEATQLKQARERLDIEALYGASGTYGDSKQLIGLVFEGGKTPPPDWIPVKDGKYPVKDVFQPPKGKPGAEIRERLRKAEKWTQAKFHQLVTNGGGFGFSNSKEGDRGLRFSYMHPEHYGPSDGVIILVVPANQKEGQGWKAPEGCKEIKTSEYWKIRERYPVKEEEV